MHRMPPPLNPHSPPLCHIPVWLQSVYQFICTLVWVCVRGRLGKCACECVYLLYANRGGRQKGVGAKGVVLHILVTSESEGFGARQEEEQPYPCRCVR